jgi:hypothetical protein
MMDRDRGTFGSKRQGNLPPDIPGAAGDKCNAFFELHFHECTFQHEARASNRPQNGSCSDRCHRVEQYRPGRRLLTPTPGQLHYMKILT